MYVIGDQSLQQSSLSLELPKRWRMLVKGGKSKTDVYLYKKHTYIVLIDSTEVGGFSKVNASSVCQRKTITIQLCDDGKNVVAEWEIINAWSTKYTPSDFNATSNEVTIESVELAHEGIKRIKP